MNPKQIDPRTIDPNDNKAIREFLSSISEDKLKNMQDILIYFFPLWADNKVKERKLNDLADEDKKYILQTLLLFFLVHEEEQINSVLVITRRRQMVSLMMLVERRLKTLSPA